MPKLNRMTADERKAQLLEAAYKIAKKDGIRKVTCTAVAAACKVTYGLVSQYFGSREAMRAEVMGYAVGQKDAKTLAAASAHYELPDMPRSLSADVKRLSAA
jgi:TetR/AcrR family transcriptional regulator, transcriptional repressor of bet genes